MTEPLFRIRGLSFAYGDPAVLSGLDLEIGRGGLWGILGPNGSGKTTLVDLMIGARRPQAGDIRLRGRRVADYPKRDLARLIALVPQEFGARFPFSVEETVKMGRHPYLARFVSPGPRDLEAVETALARTSLTPLRHKAITELSGGEKQRVMLARALAQETEVLLLDEPTSSQDVNHALAIMDLVRALTRQKGRTAVAVMHDLNLAASFCDHLVLIHGGRVFAAGPTDRVLTPDNLWRVFGVRAEVFFQKFSHSPMVAFQRPGESA